MRRMINAPAVPTAPSPTRSAPTIPALVPLSPPLPRARVVTVESIVVGVDDEVEPRPKMPSMSTVVVVFGTAVVDVVVVGLTVVGVGVAVVGGAVTTVVGSPDTLTMPVIDGWISQWYANVPGVSNVWVTDACGVIGSLLPKPCPVTVWSVLVQFFQMMESPPWIVKVPLLWFDV